MTGEFVQFRQVFGLHRFKLHIHLVYGTVKSVWIYMYIYNRCVLVLIFEQRYSNAQECEGKYIYTVKHEP
jgi:hypothetical protein